MLTKDLLKCRVRSGAIKPVFIDGKNEELLDFAANLVEDCEASVDLPRCEVEARLERYKETRLWPGDGLVKTASARFEFAEPADNVHDKRWDVFRAAESIRKDSDNTIGLEQFQRQIADHMQTSFEDLQTSLYADLPHFSVAEKFKTLTAEQLVNRYNVGLVQGLLLQALDVKLSFAADPVLKRRVFGWLKFNRLFCEVLTDAEDEKIDLKVSGPLAMFVGSSKQAYGLKLARFVPVIFSCPVWSMEAIVKWKQKEVLLKLNQKSGLQNPRTSFASGHVPEEFRAIGSTFNEKYKKEGLALSFESGVLNLGRESYAIPDFVVTKDDKNPVYFELFHKWHQSQLESRLTILGNSPEKESLVLGVPKTLAKKPVIDRLIAEKNVRTISYADLPSARLIYSALN